MPPAKRLPYSTLLMLTFLFCTLGCAGLQSGYETPDVTISSFRALPGQGAAPKFEIGLHIVNPNRTELSLKGIAYTIRIEGHKILTGVANDLPVIDAYGEGDVTLTGTVSLFNSIAFFADLARNSAQKDLTYSLDAKLDPGTLHPIIRVSRSGTFSFGQAQ